MAFGAIILLSLVGLSGAGGPLSQRRSSAPAGTIEYPRVARWQAAEQIQVQVKGGNSRQAVVDLDRSFLQVFQLDSTHPIPAESVSTGYGTRLIFNVDRRASASTIALSVTPLAPALSAKAGIRLNGSAPIPLSLTVLP